MAESTGFVIDAVVVEEQVEFTFEALCRACAADGGDILALVHEGVLAPAGEAPEQWRFGGPSLPRARTALRLARELDIGPAGAAVVMDLLDEIAALRAQLRRGG